jgi:hypothetical protein
MAQRPQRGAQTYPRSLIFCVACFTQIGWSCRFCHDYLFNALPL